MISLDALRWCHNVGIAVIVLDHDGTPLLTSADPGVDDARLRRTQATAPPDVALTITRHLLTVKMAGHARLATRLLDAPDITATITNLTAALADADTTHDARQIEAAAAAAYFDAWHDTVAVNFAHRDLDKIPDHWTRFDSRRSPLVGGYSARRAATPINALLNYSYTLGEIECRLACLTLGLDPGLGFLHADTKARDSLALDLLETIRPDIEAFVIDLTRSRVFPRHAFTERPDGTVRVLAPLTHQLAEMMPTWAGAVAAHAEWVAHHLADLSDHPITKPTPLTSTARRTANPTTDGRPAEVGRRAPQRRRYRSLAPAKAAAPYSPNDNAAGAPPAGPPSAAKPPPPPHEPQPHPTPTPKPRPPGPPASPPAKPPPKPAGPAPSASTPTTGTGRSCPACKRSASPTSEPQADSPTAPPPLSAAANGYPTHDTGQR